MQIYCTVHSVHTVVYIVNIVYIEYIVYNVHSVHSVHSLHSVHTVYFLSCGLRGSDFYFWRIQFPDTVSKISQQLFRSNQFLTFFKDPFKHIHYIRKCNR